MISKLKTWFAALGVALLFILSAYNVGRVKGSSAEKDKAKIANAKSVSKAREIEHEIENLSGDDIDRRLSKWMRDKPS